MSKTYKFSIMLDVEYSEKNILSILKNGESIGCIYKKDANDKDIIVTTDEAANSIWKYYLKQSPPFICINYSTTHFFTYFSNKNNKIHLYMSPTHIAWKKRYDLCAWYGIHFYRYQTFILNFIGNTTITHLETYEWFESPYYPENEEQDKKIYIKFYTYWPYDIYHHFKVNSHILRMTWQDIHNQPINLKKEYNILETILHNKDTTQCWYGIKDNIKLKFTLHKKLFFIIEPMYSTPLGDTQLNQKQLFNDGLRITIELFKNMPVVRFITFQEDKDIEAINTMDEQ